MWILPLRYPDGRVRAVTHVRSSAIVTAQSLLRETGKHAAYEEGLAPEARRAVLGIVPGSWVPVEAALETSLDTALETSPHSYPERLSHGN